MPRSRSIKPPGRATATGRPKVNSSTLPRRQLATSLLAAPGWRSEVKAALTRVIRRGAGKRLPVTLDFDNTIVCGDIQEAMLAVLLRRGALDPARIPPTLSPSFRLSQGALVTPGAGPDLTAYYEAFLAPTVHGAADPAPMANGYAWAVEILEGFTCLDIVRATEEAFAFAQPRQQRLIEITPGQTGYPAPFFYPEMVELILQLRRHDFDVWIVSASNVWSVRWMIARGLNPLLEEAGCTNLIPAGRVLGISTLLQDPVGALYKDSVLVRESHSYAVMDECTLSTFRLTTRLQFPVPTYSGKVGCIWDALGQRPYLAAGDSPGDHSMLAFSQHRLWLMRLEKPAYQEATIDCIRRTGRKGWSIQPVRSREAPGFLASLDSSCAPGGTGKPGFPGPERLLRIACRSGG